jgi:hypothetical protein
MSEELKPCQLSPERAIEILWGEVARNQQPLHCTRKELCDAVEMAEESITRAQQPNEPLTVDKLRQMIGQWVWVESKDVLCPNGWYRVEPQFRETISLAGVDGTIYETSITNGDSVSYRRPPEAGEKG